MPRKRKTLDAESRPVENAAVKRAAKEALDAKEAVGRILNPNTEDNMARIEENMREYVRLKKEIDHLKVLMSVNQAVIQAYMADNQLSMFERGDFTCRQTTYTPTKFDAAQFKADHPRMAKQYTVKGTPVTRFTCKTRTEAEE